MSVSIEYKVYAVEVNSRDGYSSPGFADKDAAVDHYNYLSNMRVRGEPAYKNIRIVQRVGI